MISDLPLPLANMERFYSSLCRASGLEYSNKGKLRWYDWLASDQLVRVFFADWLDEQTANEVLYPWLLRFPQAVSILTWQPMASRIRQILSDAGLELSLNAWGMELLEPAISGTVCPANDFQIIEVKPGSALFEYATLVGTHLIGHRSYSMFQAFASLLEEGLTAGVRCYAACNQSGVIMATTTLFCDAERVCGGLYHVATIPEFRGRGLAGALVQHAVSIAQQSGMKNVILQTAKLEARRIYERIGFRHTMEYQRWTRKETTDE